MKKRFLTALLAYTVLAGLALYLLSGKILAAVLILYGGLLAKTLLATVKKPFDGRATQDNSVPE